MSDYALILFDSSHDAIRAEKLLGAELPVTMMPVPRRFSASCGISLRFAASEQPRVEALMAAHELRGTIRSLSE